MFLVIILLLLNYWAWFLPDQLQLLLLVIFINDCLIIIYHLFLPPKYRYQIHINIKNINISFPFGLVDNNKKIYFTMDKRKKIGLLIVLFFISYSLYIKNVYLLITSIFLPIFSHIIFLYYLKSIKS